MANATGRVPSAETQWDDNKVFRCPAAVAKTFYPGMMIALNAAGNAVSCDDTTGIRFDGINVETNRIVVQTGFTVAQMLLDQSYQVPVNRPWRFQMAIATAALTDIGVALYALYDNQVAFAAGVSNSIFVGWVDDIVPTVMGGSPATVVSVRPAWAGQSVGGVVGFDGSTLTFTGTGTGTMSVVFPDNLANALFFAQGSNTYLKFTTTDGSELSLLTAPAATGVTNAGGSVQLLAGTGGTTSGTGGTVTIAAGAGGAGASVGTGGAVSMTGGASTGSGAGGAASLVGGAGGLVSTGGQVLVTGGAGGATSGNGGAVTCVGGAGTGSSGVGGVFSGTGGAGIGASAGGVGKVVGGLGGSSGAGGNAQLTGGAGGSASGTGGIAAVAGGAGTAAGATGGAATVTAGAGGSTGNGGAVTIAGGAGGSSSGNGGALNLNGGGQTSGTVGIVSIQKGVTAGANGTIGSALMLGSDGLFGIWWGSGVPSNPATINSLFIRTDGSTSATRMYCCSVSSGTWVACTTAS